MQQRIYAKRSFEHTLGINQYVHTAEYWYLLNWIKSSWAAKSYVYLFIYTDI